MDMYKNEDMDYEPAKMLAEFYVWWVPAEFLRKFSPQWETRYEGGLFSDNLLLSLIILEIGIKFH